MKQFSHSYTCIYCANPEFCFFNLLWPTGAPSWTVKSPDLGELQYGAVVPGVRAWMEVWKREKEKEGGGDGQKKKRWGVRGCRVAWHGMLLVMLLLLLHRLHRSIPPSERMEKTRSGYVIPHKQQEKRTVEKGIAGEGGRFPAQHSLFSYFSMDTMNGIWSGFFLAADIKVDMAVSSIFTLLFKTKSDLDTVHSAALLRVPSL